MDIIVIFTSTPYQWTKLFKIPICQNVFRLSIICDILSRQWVIYTPSSSDGDSWICRHQAGRNSDVLLVPDSRSIKKINRREQRSGLSGLSIVGSTPRVPGLDLQGSELRDQAVLSLPISNGRIISSQFMADLVGIPPLAWLRVRGKKHGNRLIARRWPATSFGLLWFRWRGVTCQEFQSERPAAGSPLWVWMVEKDGGIRC